MTSLVAEFKDVCASNNISVNEVKQLTRTFLICVYNDKYCSVDVSKEFFTVYDQTTYTEMLKIKRR